MMTMRSHLGRVRPRICMLLETFHPLVGGGETQARLLAEQFVAFGHQVLVITRRLTKDLNTVAQLGSIRIHRIPPLGSGHLKKWGMLVSSLPILIQLHRHYDILFVPGFRVLGMAAVLTGKLFGKPCILKADSNGEMSGAFFAAGLRQLGLAPSSSMIRRLLSIRNRVLRRADCFVAISSEIAAELQRYDVPPSKICQIPNGVDTQIFRPVALEDKQKLRQELGIPLSGTVIIFTGRLVSYKGLPLLVQVWREIRRKHAKARLLLVGSGGAGLENCEADLKQYVTVNRLEQSVIFTGDVNNVHQYLQASDIFVFPTENEAFGISLVEAMACGLPAISTPVGGVKEIIDHKRNGLLVKTGDFQQLYDAFDTLMADRALAARLGQAAWQTVLNRYSKESVTRKYLELFHRVSVSGPGEP